MIHALDGSSKRMLQHAPPDGDDISLYQFPSRSFALWNNTTAKTLLSITRDGVAAFSANASAPNFLAGTASVTDNRTRADNAQGSANTAYTAANNAQSSANTAQTSANNAQGSANTAYNRADDAWGKANDAQLNRTPQHWHTYTRTSWTNYTAGDGRVYMISGAWQTINSGYATW
jgi:hypothetical protein